MGDLKQWNDADFTSEVLAARLQGPRPASKVLLLFVVLFFVAAAYWASTAYIDEVTHGEGKVIPSSQVQVIQNLEGGILKEIMVTEGAIVEAGQVLLRIDDTGFASSLGEMRGNYNTLLGQASRLKAEAENTELKFPEKLEKEAPQIVYAEKNLFAARKAEMASQLGILEQQADQRRQEMVEVEGKLSKLRQKLTLIQEELDLIAPLVKQGIVPKLDHLRLRKEVGDIRGEIEATKLAIPRAEAVLREAEQRVSDRQLNFQSESRLQYNKKMAEMAAINQTLLAAKDRVSRTEVRSPLKGVVKELKIRTVGGVIQPGQALMEVVPLQDNLLVEAKIRPADIAFIKPGQPVTVKFTAYDFSIYGGLSGSLQRISADTIVDEKSGEAFYKIIVKTDVNYLEKYNKKLPIIPGMVASVDLLTGEKTILDYILKPILKTKSRALQER
ncbi:MAG: HlyD family type I secretion periplasmic adaptor subunit [Rhodospirillales bacterium]|nr:HlyD family type I secretion periplasmic adaptor subunit [Rhodospirillales bacterium]